MKESNIVYENGPYWVIQEGSMKIFNDKFTTTQRLRAAIRATKVRK